MSAAPSVMAEMDLPLLRVENLRTYFDTLDGTVRSVDGVSYDVQAGQTLGVVGESGCGKSVTALSILRLIPHPPGRYAGGRILFRGQDLLALSERDMRAVRGDRIAMVFQEPMSSLNPVMTVGRQIAEVVQLHQGKTRRESMDWAVEMLRQVQMPEPQRRAREYPFQMSGGMRQRVMIALALACRPDVLIADEPTTALDVTVQAQVLDLLQDLQQRLGMAMVLITHDLGVVAEHCDRVVVMYAGRKVEEAPVQRLFERPRHPYTRALMASMPLMDTKLRRLPEIAGMLPPPCQLQSGCAFAPRCAQAQPHCRNEAPAFETDAEGHGVACFFAGSGAAP